MEPDGYLSWQMERNGYGQSRRHNASPPILKSPLTSPRPPTILLSSICRSKGRHLLGVHRRKRQKPPPNCHSCPASSTARADAVASAVATLEASSTALPSSQQTPQTGICRSKGGRFVSVRRRRRQKPPLITCSHAATTATNSPAIASNCPASAAARADAS